MKLSHKARAELERLREIEKLARSTVITFDSDEDAEFSDALDSLRAALFPVTCGERKMDSADQPTTANSMKDKILNWFAVCEVGASSKVMAMAVIDMPHDRSHPYDPDDLNRCLLLLEFVPEILSRMEKVAAISDTWAALIGRWSEVEQCFLDEVGLNWTKGNKAPRTFDLMKEIRSGCG